jgi:hypothetical protein
MGTTTSVLAVRGDQGWLAHVGDSRIYLVRADTIQQLTDDHSLVATMVREGLLTSAEAETHPRRNVLQRSMGVAEEVEVDVRGPIDLRPGDTFILCSDGLHGLVKEAELKEIARAPIDRAADEYLRRALERGAPDNVTVIVARVETTDLDETVVDRLDETQPLSSLDETMRDTQPLAPITAAQIDAASSDAPSVMETAGAPTIETPRPAEPLARTEEVAFGGDPAHDETVKTAEVVFGTPANAPATPASALAAAAAAPPAASQEDVKTAEVVFGGAVKSAPAPAPELNASVPKTTDVPAEKPLADTPRAPAPKTTPSPAPTVTPRPGSSSVLLWLVIVVVVLGAAGAWFYWNQQQANAKESSTSTSR